MDIDVSFINKTDILPKIPLVGLGKHKKSIKSQIDCYDCDNCYSGSVWIPRGGSAPSDCIDDCDCRQNYNCDYDCDDCDCDCNNCDCNPYDDLIDNCYWGDDDDWYPGGWDALCGDCNCDCDYDCW